MFKSESLPVAVKKILLFAVVLVAALLQNTQGLLPEFLGARVFWLLPLTVCIGMFDGELSGLIYGAIGGAFWDVCSASPDGFCTFYLALAGCVSGLLVRFFVRKKMLAQYCITAVVSVLFCVLYWLFTVCIPVGDRDSQKLLGFYLPAAVVSTLFSFICYFSVSKIADITEKV